MPSIHPPVSSQTLRQLFFEYFEARGHTQVASGPLVPLEDDSLLFTNAGMAPFKNIFTGQTKAPYPSAVSIQRCMRAGGKHNDLENVGYTARHHTFFEMLGNFSFGSYFKREAIQYAWEFLTQILKLPAERLWVTVFKEDPETESIWLNEMKVDPYRFSRCEANDNFWSMGESGPCGPCTEIFYDHGSGIAGGPPGSPTADGDRYVEIWNLVFMQYEKTPSGQLIALPKPCVDTGMGLERVAAIMQGVTNNYESDLFQPLIQAIAHHVAPNTLPPSTLQVIADHVRASVFLMMEGIYPGREGRAYVLRRIIRRAARHGYQYGLHTPFLYKFVSAFVNQMSAVYPELMVSEARITQHLLKEERQFENTLHHGMKCFEEAVSQLEGSVLSGETVFKLYDTYGFPVDLTADLARERGLQVDHVGFDSEMQHQQQKSQAAHQFTTRATTAHLHLEHPTKFTGYHTLKEHDCKIIALLKEGQTVSELHEGESGQVILDHTPFYAESGGQVGDQGELKNNNLENKSITFQVVDTQKQGDPILHIGKVIAGDLAVGQTLSASVNAARRYSITLNHSATHLLHAALRRVLGDEVQQKGSLVAPTYLRFDFSYAHAVTSEQAHQVEHLVNQYIWDNLTAQSQWMSQEKAKQSGTIALFSEKYGENVRVLQIGEVSIELCGGTHIKKTSEIGLFKITSISSIASGTRRIEAVTGQYAFEWFKALEHESLEVAHLLKTDRAQSLGKLQKQQQILHTQTDEIAQLRHYLTNTLANTLHSKAQKINKTTLIISALPALAAPQLREIIDQLKSKHPKSIIVLACIIEDTIQVSIGVSQDNTTEIKANELIPILAPLVSGKGGGRPDFAQMKGYTLNKIEVILDSIKQKIIQRLS